ncbi:probable FBP26 - fructose-2,6-bisphosphatase [Melanopsichium pennsylvanicum]|uniref:fructose-2,6-bisphosphate 2-phosphatase n=2 Tax=Melanopsichium pennsylvanicum TaxID=63383 RepID=A0AAJ4XLW0_9BASI|nr:probable FBP26-fructose-2,6-bisphosphatase [Melanopsichium pennsylvanicum 4]SNX84336.1 probable FBP26 - fructose-2,6-bisphosphatase [Melanopsichium pennsylvanicum]
MSQKSIDIQDGAETQDADACAIDSAGSSPVIPHAIIHHRHLSGGPGVGPGTASPGRYSAIQAQQLAQRMADQAQKESNPNQTSISRSGSVRSASRKLSGSTPGFSSASPRHFSQSRPAPFPAASQREAFDVAVASSNLASSSDGLQALLRDHPELVSSSLAAAAGPNLAMTNTFSTSTRSGSVAGSRGNSVPGTPFEGPDSVNQQGYVLPVGGSLSNSFHQTQAQAQAQSQSQHQQHYSHHHGPMSPTHAHDNGRGRILKDAPEVGEGGPSSYHPSGLGTALGLGHGIRTGLSTPNLGAAGARPDYSGAKIVVCMVGLPARGKSYVANRVLKYLRWLEYDVKVFNVGQLRRALARAKYNQSGIKEDHTASFFDPSNPSAYKLRSQMAEECLEQLIGWLKRGGNVGIHDATNSTTARRREIADRIAKEPDLKLVFLESICTDPEVIEKNIAVKVSSGDPDYAGMTPEDAKRDFLARIKHYEDTYEPLNNDGSESDYSYVKVTDVGKSVTINRIQGYLESRIAFYLMNLHLTPRNIFFSRHGESQYNVEGKIGGDSDLSPRGWMYAKALPQLIKDNIGDAPLTVWHSTLRRTGQTASELPYPKLAWKSLDELDAGVCDAMTYEEIEKYYPEDYANRDDDKFNYRYRGGESYRDVVVRLEPIIMELERQENILIIGHQAIIRCLYAYFHALSQEDLPYIKIPLHTVIQLTPKAYGCDEKRFQLPIEAVDTHRPKPLRSDLDDHPPTPPLDPLEEAATSAAPSQVKPQLDV